MTEVDMGEVASATMAQPQDHQCRSVVRECHFLRRIAKGQGGVCRTCALNVSWLNDDLVGLKATTALNGPPARLFRANA